MIVGFEIDDINLDSEQDDIDDRCKDLYFRMTGKELILSERDEFVFHNGELFIHEGEKIRQFQPYFMKFSERMYECNMMQSIENHEKILVGFDVGRFNHDLKLREDSGKFLKKDTYRFEDLKVKAMELAKKLDIGNPDIKLYFWSEFC